MAGVGFADLVGFRAFALTFALSLAVSHFR